MFVYGLGRGFLLVFRTSCYTYLYLYLIIIYEYVPLSCIITLKYIASYFDACGLNFETNVSSQSNAFKKKKTKQLVVNT